jgi:hypothetical protein
MERKVYVITDAPVRERVRVTLAHLLRPTGLIAMIAAPLWAVASVPLGLLLGWHPLILFAAVVVGSPVFIHLTDLLAARLGLPPLGWVASQALGRSVPVDNQKENDIHG